ncbi:YqhA family protein [Caminibacter pacificus]|uniref:Membrane protein YqhA n=1 Tax=Caminibacter pacificus TaxID=1424653 RepID=A0AAJ4REA1_9BACT|nr:YqhA family protein [Caminibacter pacificus]NPA88051.1 YqhA family protein [Campylobacterota bacterium]QCI28075.1 YqhA family protein [Caminibacter pacificus]ROR41217.1 putative membrane protein YqhA [Caminibacter pacificus]
MEHTSNNHERNEGFLLKNHDHKRGIIEAIFEASLWKSRLIAILAVIFGMIGAVSLFLIASADVWHMAVITYKYFFMHYHPENFHEELIGGIIGAVDLYLIAVVLLIFSFGIYELFISEIDDAENSEIGAKILAIHSLDELKDKLGKVVVMVLIVSFFKKVIHMDFNTPLSMLYLAGSILALALALYFMHKGEH